VCKIATRFPIFSSVKHAPDEKHRCPLAKRKNAAGKARGPYDETEQDDQALFFFM
jgi:hypothetical protein